MQARDSRSGLALRQYLPELKVRVVNVVDLMYLCSPDRHPDGMTNDSFIAFRGATLTPESQD